MNTADGKKITNDTEVQFFDNKDWKYLGSRDSFKWSLVTENETFEIDKIEDANGNEVDSVVDSAKNNFQISSELSHTNCTIGANKISCPRPAATADAAEWMDSGITYHW